LNHRLFLGAAATGGPSQDAGAARFVTGWSDKNKKN